jgi:hypothetical protein
MVEFFETFFFFGLVCRSALLTNVQGLRNVMTISKQFQKLEAFVYVSSIYANCDHSYIEEKIYPCAVEPQKILNILE